MILKEQKKCAVVLLITGTVMFLTTWLTEDSHGFDFLNGLGCGLFFAGALRLLRIYRIGRDSQKAADYDIYVKDERTAYIASRARNRNRFAERSTRKSLDLCRFSRVRKRKNL